MTVPAETLLSTRFEPLLLRQVRLVASGGHLVKGRYRIPIS